MQPLLEVLRSAQECTFNDTKQYALLTTIAEPAGEEQELNKRQLKRQKKQREEAVRKAELARLEGSTQNNAADFERELMGSPNSSYLWIKYMAFQISLGEVDKARAIADQALQRIHYRWLEPCAIPCY